MEIEHCPDNRENCSTCVEKHRLCSGDPSNHPASYTRFVLPFAYNLEGPTTSEKPTYFYEQEKLDSTDEKNIDIWRRRYLTDETEEVLFRRAKWYKLNIPDKKIPMTFDKMGRTLDVWLKPPRLVLFEFPSVISTLSPNHSILRSGFLIQEAYFDKASGATMDDLLLLNELFRYWQRPYDGHDGYNWWKVDSVLYARTEQERRRERLDKSGTKIYEIYTPEAYTGLIDKVPLSPEAENRNDEKPNESDDYYFDRWANMLNYSIEYNGNYLSLVSDSSRENAKGRNNGNYIKTNTSDSGWMIYADNRAFVWTCAIMKNGVRSIKDNFAIKTIDEYSRWARLLNIDPPGWGKSSDFERHWVDERTYKRWFHYDSVSGFSYHSGAMLAPPETNPELWKNFGAMYFDQMLLLLYLRVSLFRFSMELNRISSEAVDKGEKNWISKFQKLRWSFSIFANLYQFPLLSNQQQGVEMYTMQRRHMEVDDLFKEIKDEIHSSYEFLVVQQDQEQTSQATILTRFATIGLPLALALSFLGMDDHILSAIFPLETLSSGYSLVIWTVCWFFSPILLGILIYLGNRKGGNDK